MNLGIVGCRHFQDYAVFCDMMKHLMSKHLGGREIARVISGGATGVDRLAERWAEESGIPCTVFSVSDEPDEFSFTEKAHSRNQKIVDASNVVFAFPSGGSRGTWDTVRRAKRQYPNSVFVTDLNSWKSDTRPM